jgi:PilZ domain
MTVQNLAGRGAPAPRAALRRGWQSGQARNGPNRRRYPRIPALIHCRPAGEEFFAQPLEPVDIGFGGVRIHSHQEYGVGEFLRLDIFFPRVKAVPFTTEIMWIERLGNGSPTRFDVGLAFVELNPAALKLLLSVLTSEGELVGSAHLRASQATARVEGSFESPVDESDFDEPASGVSQVMPQSTIVRKARDARPMLSRTPIVLLAKADLRALPLDSRSAFLVSLIDGHTTVESLVDLSGMPAEETLDLLDELRLRHIVVLC